MSLLFSLVEEYLRNAYVVSECLYTIGISILEINPNSLEKPFNDEFCIDNYPPLGLIGRNTGHCGLFKLEFIAKYNKFVKEIEDIRQISIHSFRPI